MMVYVSQDGKHGRDYVLARREMMQRERDILNEYYATLRGGLPIREEQFCTWENINASAYIYPFNHLRFLKHG